MKTLALLLTAASAASATVALLGPSDQSITYTGIGPNSAGLGTVKVQLGTCVYFAPNTVCTLTGKYTGIGSGGTYQFIVTDPGNGVTPLQGVQTAPGSNFVNISFVAPGSLTFRLRPASGDPVTFYFVPYSITFIDASVSCSGVSLCSQSNVATTPLASISGRITGQVDLTPVVATPVGVVTATSYGGSQAIAPGTWIEIYGHNLATVLRRTWGGADFNGAQAPNTLAGTTVTIADKRAYVDYVNEDQVNAQVPTGIPTGNQKLVVSTAGGDSIGIPVIVNSVQPAILAPPVFKFAAGQYAVALFPDGNTFVLPPGFTNAVKTARAKPGDTITLYGVGFGPVTPNIDAGIIVSQPNNLANFQAAFASVPATIQFAGLVAGNVGLYQFNVVVPKVPAKDSTLFTFNLGGNTGTQTLFSGL